MYKNEVNHFRCIDYIIEHCNKPITEKMIKELHFIFNPDLDTLLDFHVQFEWIYPFQDGNGRIGQLLLLKECLKHNIVIPCASQKGGLSGL